MIQVNICFWKVQRCDGEDDCPYVSPDEEEIVDESDRNNTIESTLDHGSVVKYEIPRSNMSKIRKAGLCYSKKTCCSKVFLKNEKVRK